MEYDLLQPWNTLDPWQEEVLKTEGNLCLRSGRQTGKSTIISIKVGEYAINNNNKFILIISSTERQAYHLFIKVKNYILFKYGEKIIKGRATDSYINFTNGSAIYCLPVGDSAQGIRGYTVDLLVVDEAAFLPDSVWESLTPMLAVTKGNIILLSTPHGKEGYFYECFQDPMFSKFHISTLDCPRVDKNFLDREKERMTKKQFTQEYLGEFISEISQFFPDELIKKCCIIKRRERILDNRRYYLGVDIARMGEDESTFEIIDRTNKEFLEQVENLITKHTLTTETTKMVLNLNQKYDFKQIFVDDGGMGVGVFDQLLTEESTRRKTIAINNSSRPLTRDEKQKKRTLKEDVYNNLLMLMERGMIKLLDDDEIFLSLKSIQYEYDERGKFKIYGNYSHIADGLVRAAWCSKDKSLNIWAG